MSDIERGRDGTSLVVEEAAPAPAAAEVPVVGEGEAAAEPGAEGEAPES